MGGLCRRETAKDYSPWAFPPLSGLSLPSPLRPWCTSAPSAVPTASKESPPRRLYATTRDGWSIAVHQRSPTVRRFSEPVLLCHGLATNHLNLDFEPPYSLAQAFAAAGFEVFSLDWRGAGDSQPPAGRGRFDFDADDLIQEDAPAVMELLLQTTKAEHLFWVGHSLGGLVGYAVLGEPGGSRVRGLCSLGAPVYFHYPRWLSRILRLCLLLAWPVAFRQRLLSLFCAPFVGRLTLPLSDVLVNPKAIAPAVLRSIYANLIDSMGYKLLRQLDDWTRHDRFCSRDGARDYRGRLHAVAQPVLVLGGTQGRTRAAHRHPRPGGAPRLEGQDGDALRQGKRRRAGVRARRPPLWPGGADGGVPAHCGLGGGARDAGGGRGHAPGAAVTLRQRGPPWPTSLGFAP